MSVKWYKELLGTLSLINAKVKWHATTMIMKWFVVDN